jgi:hypothetical protein
LATILKVRSLRGVDTLTRLSGMVECSYRLPLFG